MSEARLSLGLWGEEQAVLHLRRQGWTIVERNLRTPVGEVDIIARSGKILAFVEVKTRRSAAFGLPQEAVGPRKQRQILRAAQWYLNGEGVGNRRLQARFDVIAILAATEGEMRLEHIVNAFGL